MTQQVQHLTADDFFAGFLAALAISRRPVLNGSRTALNRAFYRAIQDPVARFVDLDALNVDYDPLYGLSPWFDRELTRAQRDLLVGFPNPSYATVEIKLGSDEAEELLAELGHRDQFLQFALVFLNNLKSA
ncbi:MAG TPA: hypothetical protein VI485_16375 [Vicinamibacterales bacterium]|nr:hypothetical protein [Vicinamibacterales bacterium]